MDNPGQKFKKIRNRLGLTIRNVEAASRRIAKRRGSDEYVVGLSRLSDIENRSSVPSVFRIYSLCAIYRLSLAEVLEWYGIRLADLLSDASAVEAGKTLIFNREDLRRAADEGGIAVWGF